MSEGVKNDSEKPRMDLLSGVWVEGVSGVLAFGAKKYAAHNWRKGLERSRLLGACLRHVFAYLRGEDNDPETGLLHLYHASCCLMFASELHFTHPDLDDRYKVPAKKEPDTIEDLRASLPKDYPYNKIKAGEDDSFVSQFIKCEGLVSETVMRSFQKRPCVDLNTMHNLTTLRGERGYRVKCKNCNGLYEET